MKLSRPTQAVWIVALVLGIFAIIAYLVTIPGLSPLAFWLLAVAWLLLVLGTLLEGL